MTVNDCWILYKANKAKHEISLVYIFPSNSKNKSLSSFVWAKQYRVNYLYFEIKFWQGADFYNIYMENTLYSISATECMPMKKMEII
jgi:hypothetical protein